MRTGNGPGRRRALAALAALLLATTAHAQTGSIAGTVLDGATGESIIGANVRLAGTATGATTDLDGHYEIRNVPAGRYSVAFSYIGYASKTVTGVELQAGAATRLDLTLSTEALGLDEVTVEARALRNNEATLLRDRQKALAVSDAISAESIGRSGSSSAADAMSRVTGASVVGGKYVSVRGLGDRYTTAQLNGSELPSADPDRRSVQLDLLPAALLDNVVTTKTFTPDKPGNFSGGAVDINTKDFPDRRMLTFSSGLSGNTQATGATMLTAPGSPTDWLGYDSGRRALPRLVQGAATIPDATLARADAGQARALDAFSRAFSSVMAPMAGTGEVGRSFSLSGGDRIRVGRQQIGVVASLSYSYGNSYYGGGQANQWQLDGSSQQVDALRSDQVLADQRGTVEAVWGALGTLTYQPRPGHRVSATLLNTQTGEATARALSGKWETQLPGDPFFESRALLYTQRTLRSYQFKGRHTLARRWTPTLAWNVALTATEQDEPDLRFFANDYVYLDADGNTTGDAARAASTVYNINASLYTRPTHYFRNLNEHNSTYDVVLSAGVFKVGGYYQAGHRRFRERSFAHNTKTNQAGFEPYSGDPAAYFAPGNVGITDSVAYGTRTFYAFGNYITDESEARNNYDGDQHIAAGFAMATIPVTRKLRLIGGARYETTRLDVASRDTLVARGRLSRGDLLPSLGAVYSLTDNMNLRLAYGRTLARPTFREIGPFKSFEYVGDLNRIGNPDLDRTLIDNVDARYEWFSRPGEIYAVSVFYKHLTNPIEFTFLTGDRLYTWENVPGGNVYGVELELRRQVLLRGQHLLQMGFNASLIRSAVDADSSDRRLLRADDPKAKTTRPLFGQSPYLVNADLSYTREGWGTAFSIYYNVFGPRLAAVVTGPTPDVYEQPRHSLDVSLAQRVGRTFSVKASAKNVLDARHRETASYRGRTYVWREYDTGRQFSLGLSFNLQ